MKKHRTVNDFLRHATILTAFAALVNGCSHTTIPVLKQQNFPTTITNWHNPSFANPSNPYDSIGFMHNQGLDYVAARLNSISPDTLYPSTDTFAVYFADSVLGYLNPTTGVDDSLSSHLRVERFALTHEDSLLTPAVMGTTNYNTYQTLNTLLNNSDSLEQLIDSIKSFESTALSTLSGSDLECALVASAIARYSASYWDSPDSANFPDIEHHQHPLSRAIVYMRAGKRNGDTPLRVNVWKESGIDVVGGLCGLFAGPVGAFFGAEGASAAYVIAEW